jgi:hypothetical protein
MELGLSQDGKDLIKLFLSNTISSSPIAKEFFALGSRISSTGILYSIFTLISYVYTTTEKSSAAKPESDSRHFILTGAVPRSSSVE